MKTKLAIFLSLIAISASAQRIINSKSEILKNPSTEPMAFSRGESVQIVQTVLANNLPVVFPSTNAIFQLYANTNQSSAYNFFGLTATGRVESLNGKVRWYLSTNETALPAGDYFFEGRMVSGSVAQVVFQSKLRVDAGIGMGTPAYAGPFYNKYAVSTNRYSVFVSDGDSNIYQVAIGENGAALISQNGTNVTWTVLGGGPASLTSNSFLESASVVWTSTNGKMSASVVGGVGANLAQLSNDVTAAGLWVGSNFLTAAFLPNLAALSNDVFNANSWVGSNYLTSASLPNLATLSNNVTAAGLWVGSNYLTSASLPNLATLSNDVFNANSWVNSNYLTAATAGAGVTNLSGNGISIIYTGRGTNLIALSNSISVVSNVSADSFSGTGIGISSLLITNTFASNASPSALLMVGSDGRVRFSGGYTASAYNVFVMMDINSNIFYSPFISTATNTFTNRQIFSYTGNTNSFTVPAGITQLWVKCWGAGGGVGQTTGTGGFSAYVHTVTPAETLDIVVGQGGQITASTNAYGTNQIAIRAWPNGGAPSQSGPTPSTIGGGGGWSAVFRGTNLLQAAGGGGGGQLGGGVAGGAGGGVTGGAGSAGASAGGTGASQSAGGSNFGGYFFGGSAIATTNSQVLSGGGGGYWGGGGGRTTSGGGGGGSGYIPNVMYGVNIQGNNTSDSDYQSGWGASGGASSAGNPGGVIIRW